jgi:adenylate kinase
MLQFIESRQHTRAFDLPEEPEKIPLFVNNLFQDFKLILIMGISGTGKSTLLSHYKGLPSWTYTLWNRDTIFKMLWNDGSRDESFYKKIDKFESDVFPELILRPYHQVIVESWARLPNVRARYLTYLPKGMGRSQIVVMDGPVDKIVERNIQVKNHEKFLKDEVDLKFFLEEKYHTTHWPKFSEGWDVITYINTFGEVGREHLLARLV